MNPTDDGWRVDVPLPGIDPKDVALEAAGNNLTFAPRSRARATMTGTSRDMSRRSTIPQFLDLEKLTASHRHGMLRLTLPLKESVKPRRIQIETQTEEQKQLGGAVMPPRGGGAESGATAHPVPPPRANDQMLRVCERINTHIQIWRPLMLSTRIFGLACAVAVFVCLVAAPASAQPLDKRTLFTFSGPVTLPGVTLPAGSICSAWPIQTAAPGSCKY